ncbi:MAG: aminodeoxychorismate synthase component I [Cyclobacteriaceae bacterium]|nr:aminodeoxychorismate synthase component I [Cyclobacteriaceae bacterium]
MQLNDFVKTLNEWGQQQVPFLFLVDYEMKKPQAWKVSEVDHTELLYDFHGITNAQPHVKVDSFDFQIAPPEIASYEKKFHAVIQSLNRGDTFLANLTDRTEIELNASLKEIFYESQARYKISYRDEFVVFSPEIFIQIRDQSIYSFPMKGTIDASIPNAAQVILSNEKEMAEHVTMVDLIRNDLSLVASGVKVSKFRYIEELKTNQRNLLQVSSRIEGELPTSYLNHIGDILVALLPAGSISGAPKRKTCELLAAVEGRDRGYYTGVCGYFDGQQLDAGVMIRFIEKENEKLFFRSGGGITTQSNLQDEFQELINKVYVPIS